MGRAISARTCGKGERFEVVGVVKDHRLHTVAERPAPYIHFAAAQRPSNYNYVVAHTDGDAAQLLAAMRRELLALEPGLVFVSSATMETSLAMSLLPHRVGALLAAGFGGVGTLLAAIGLYGVIAFSVARRTREIGVRIAIGADAGAVLRLVMRQGLTLVGRSAPWSGWCSARWRLAALGAAALRRRRVRPDRLDRRAVGVVCRGAAGQLRSGAAGDARQSGHRAAHGVGLARARGLPTLCQAVAAAKREGSYRVPDVSIATRMRSHRSATLRRARACPRPRARTAS